MLCENKSATVQRPAARPLDHDPHAQDQPQRGHGENPDGQENSPRCLRAPGHFLELSLPRSSFFPRMWSLGGVFGDSPHLLLLRDQGAAAASLSGPGSSRSPPWSRRCTANRNTARRPPDGFHLEKRLGNSVITNPITKKLKMHKLHITA